METILQSLQNQLDNRVKTTLPLAPYTTFKIGGPAEFFYEAQTTEQLVKAVRTARSLSLPLTVLGGGTNVLVSDDGIAGLVVRNTAHEIRTRGMKGTVSDGIAKRTVYVEADSGVMMNYLVRTMIEQGLAGLEMHLGLPGTVGGALYMNSKWSCPELSYVGDAVHQALILTPAGDLETVGRQYFRFGYDTSKIQTSGDIVISVTFALTESDGETLWKRANESIRRRHETQPQGVKSAGCVFRNITRAEAITANTPAQSVSAGYLIDHAGFKGRSVGDAVVSDIHANFIVNRGSATAADIIQLITQIKNQVRKTFQVTLTEEIVKVGRF